MKVYSLINAEDKTVYDITEDKWVEVLFTDDIVNNHILTAGQLSTMLRACLDFDPQMQLRVIAYEVTRVYQSEDSATEIFEKYKEGRI